MALGYVRPARPAEAGEIARLQLATWRVAYRRMLPRRVLDGLDEGFLAARWAEAIEAPPSHRHRVLVAIEQAGPAPTEPTDGTLGDRTTGDGPDASGAPSREAAQEARRRPDPAGGSVPGLVSPEEVPPRHGTAGGRDDIVGFIAAGPADEQALAPDEPPLGAGVVAVTDLLVEPRWGRRGHGSRLLAAAVSHWRPDGFAAAVAWAYEQDTATRRFLTSAGWEPDGAARALDVDDLLVPQLRLHTAL